MISIDLFYLIQILLPPVHRIVEVKKYMKAAAKPLSELLDSFYLFFDDIKYVLQFNGQVIYLEHILNDQFDNVDRGIYIEDADNNQNVFIFNLAEENEQLFLFNLVEEETPVYFYNYSEVSNFDFIVYIPASVTFDEELVKYYVNKYKCAAKRWKIEIV
ncbi:MAG: hypothetical protein ORN50_04700 [Crocinitomicaceae bacterium]|nr:hypothetical protein [Crocinitomicaceae bacterium]